MSDSSNPRPSPPRSSSQREPEARRPWQRLIIAFESPGPRRALQATIVLLLIVMPWISSQYTTVILTNALLYVVLCLGLNIVVGYAGLLDLGYAAFFAVGAYTVGILTQQFGVNFWVAIPFALVAAAIAGIIIGGPTLRLRSDYLAIVTLGFGEIVRFTARNLEITGGASGLSHIPEPSLFGWRIDSAIDFYYVFVVLAILAYVASQRLFDSRLGRAWLYVRHDEDAAEAMGINRVRIKLAAYVIGAIFGAIGGIFFSVNLGAISPESFSFQQSVLILLAVVLGGMGKIPGVILGAFIVVLGPELLREFDTLRLLIFAVLLLAIMLFRPSGIWPEKRA
ncbi:branched-chain amino acid ABC transporter permease [Salinicola avicenniae]|uniref:branched-chain amino acid ABC transporter permease n=1 Tax=Salinicola avicenniae TaxID=2916836 RepID=UPI00207415E0|nr:MULTISPECIES: branched-chain amino acid ABC transporter permease [unclassified Salinicola]